MAKGKYDHIINKLPRWGGQEPEYEVKVTAVKRAMLDEDPELRKASAIAEKYVEMRMEADAYDALMKEFNLRRAAIEALLEEAYEVEGTKSLGLLGGETIRVQYEPHAVTQNKVETRLWAIAHGYEDSLVLPWQTLNKITKDELLAGNPEPDGVVAHAKWKIVMTR